MIPLKRLPDGKIDPQWHGEVHQDAFAYEQCGRKNNGTFLDLGCWEPVQSSNSLALEHLGWRGLLVDINSKYTQMHRDWGRKSPTLTIAAQNIDWKQIQQTYNIGPCVDYLSLDVEDCELEVLHNLFFANFSFHVITVEHNRYSHGDGPRNKQRELLQSHGYKLEIPDVQNSTGLEFEDWWIK